MAESVEIELLKIAATAALGLVAGYIGSLINHKRQQMVARENAFCERMEEAYMLRQRLFDGHKKWIDCFNQARSSKDVTAWNSSQTWPGETMAKLRMLVTMYASDIRPSLEQVGTLHKDLKGKYNNINNGLYQGDNSSFDDYVLKTEIDALLVELERGCSQLRDAIVEKIHLRLAKSA